MMWIMVLLLKVYTCVGIAPVSVNGSLRDVADAKVRAYLSRVYNAFKGEVPHVHHQSDVFDQVCITNLNLIFSTLML